MMLNKVKANCYTFFLLRRFRFNLHPSESIFVIAYNNSRISKMPSVLFLKFKKYLEHSLLVRSIKWTNNRIIDFANNVIIRRTYRGYKKLRDWFMARFDLSFSSVVAKEAKSEFYVNPVRSIGVIFIFTTLANILFVFLLKKGIDFYGWGIRVLLVCFGLGGIFCKENLNNLKQVSFHNKWIKKLKS